MRALMLPRFQGPSARRLVALGLLIGLLMGALFFVGWWQRHVAKKKLEAAATEAAESLPRVKLAQAVAVEGGRTLTLPGSLVAVRQALVNARATGYVAAWRVDIGDRVHAGDVLAELDTPELNQQLAQARAAANQKTAADQQAVANRDYAITTAAREDALLAEGIHTKQQNDQSHAQVKVDQANVNAAEADIAAAQATVHQLEQLVSFGHVVAPFDGRITQRNIEIGTLVVAGSGQPMFRIEATDPVRVFVQVPQAFALSVKEGEAANVMVRQVPGRNFEGKVTRTAGTLDPTSRTLAVEIDVPNPTGELLGGMFAQVSLTGTLAHRVVRVPSSAVITDARGVHVAVVDASGIVHLVAAQRGLDNGTTIDIVEGLTGDERVIASPGADVSEGMRVAPP